MTHLTSWISLGVAAFVATIGYFQFRTAREQARIAHNRLVLDLFERRYEVYQSFREVMSRVFTSGKAELADFHKVAEAAGRAKLLFGDGLNQYLDRFVDAVKNLETYCRELTPDLPVDERKANVEAQRREKNSIEGFRTTGTQLFDGYIRFDAKVRTR